MIVFDPIMRPRLKHRGEEVKAVRNKYQRPSLRDIGNKWKITYWDYTSGEAKHKSKVWAKSKVPSQRQAQRLADRFMDEVNEANNAPRLESPHEDATESHNPSVEPAPGGRCTLSDLKKKCMELSWPLLKKSTRVNYEFFFTSYLLPAFGDRDIAEVSTMELQGYFNSLLGKLSPYSSESYR